MVPIKKVDFNAKNEYDMVSTHEGQTEVRCAKHEGWRGRLEAQHLPAKAFGKGLGMQHSH